MPSKPRDRPAGFTLVEVLITSSLVAIMGGLVFLSLHAGVHLFGKNVAINLPYQSSRTAFDLLQRDVHGSAAPPRLINASLANAAGPGPAAGVALRAYVSGPTLVAADAASAATLLEIRKTAGCEPHAGDLVTLPAFRIERNVVSVTSAGSTWLLSLDAALGAALTDTATSNLVAFFTRRVGYVVMGGNLLRYPELSQPSNFHVVSRGVTNATPFSFPVVAGQPDDRYLTVALTARDPGHSARSWKAVDANLNFTIAYRATTPLTTQ
jgi:prepilin-type N-terminal cleavage/methylation domain-containing protein